MYFKRGILFFLGLGVTCSIAHAGFLEHYLQKKQEESIPFASEKNIHLAYFKQPIDHKNPSTGTFLQRYYIDETYGPTDESPVFFYICGEGACSQRVLNGAIRHYAEQFHAKLVALEHRYYGESQPYPSLSTSNLKFLTTEDALNDLAHFQTHLIKEKHWNGQWIAFGGSYPGSLSAYYRLKFPELVVGALASSAPVMAKEDFIEYDEHVTKVAGPQCANLMRQAVTEVESSINDQNRLTQIKAEFDALDVIDPSDFLYLIADLGASAVQYGMHNQFCSSLATSHSPLEGYARFARALFNDMNIKAVDFTVQGAMSDNPDDYHKGLGMRQWYYQSCTEYGYWQNANPDPSLSSRSSLISLDYHHRACQRLFGLSQTANTHKINETFYVPLMDSSVSNIYFTNGENDPWSNLSLTEKNGNANNPNLTYQLIQGAAHCDDLRKPSALDSAAVISARKKMDALISSWLR